MTRRFRAPARNGEILADPPFSEIPRLVEENRRRLDRDDVLIGGFSLRYMREYAREILFSDDDIFRTVVVTGHQPELSHPGVWVKNFAVAGLARKLGAIPLNLVVDNDTLKSPSLRFPSFAEDKPASAHTVAIPFDMLDGEVPYEDRGIIDSGTFCEFLPKARALTASWGYRPLLYTAWHHIDPVYPLPLGEQFSRVRRRFETEWGCESNDVAVSELSRTHVFQVFASHILADLPRFRDVYNAAIRAYRKANRIDSANHPAPELAEGEAPFWVRTGADGRRVRATATSDPAQLRPRALTLTLFARVCLGDFFIHGIGGGKYDEVTDAIIRDYFGIEPPAYQVLSATLQLPLPGYTSTDEDVKRREHLVRDLHWNPQRHLTDEDSTRPEVRAMMAELTALIAGEPPYGKRAERRAWFRALKSAHERLRPFVWKQVAPAEAELARARVEAAANAVLYRRDYSWVLYPEETLRPFLQRFLDV